MLLNSGFFLKSDMASVAADLCQGFRCGAQYRSLWYLHRLSSTTLCVDLRVRSLQSLPTAVTARTVDSFGINLREHMALWSCCCVDALGIASTDVELHSLRASCCIIQNG